MFVDLGDLLIHMLVLDVVIVLKVDIKERIKAIWPLDALPFSLSFKAFLILYWVILKKIFSLRVIFRPRIFSASFVFIEAILSKGIMFAGGPITDSTLPGGKTMLVRLTLNEEKMISTRIHSINFLIKFSFWLLKIT